MAEELAKAQNELADMRRKQELSQAGSFFVLDFAACEDELQHQ